MLINITGSISLEFMEITQTWATFNLIFPLVGKFKKNGWDIAVKATGWRTIWLFYTDVLLSEFSLSYGFDSEPSTLFDTFAITLSWLDAESWYYVIWSH